MELVLETNNLTKKYYNFKALNNLNIHIEKGAIYGLIGKNGSGKTTLIRIICGLQNQTSGTYTIYGETNNRNNITKVRKRMGAIIETPAIYLDMSAKENLIMQAKIVGTSNLDFIPDLLKLVGLNNTHNKKAKNFSLGMRQRLGLAISLVGNPDFLILDEPINGLDPEGIIELRELILKLNRAGITILISSHYLDELSKIATHYGFLDKGTIIKEMTKEELLKKAKHKFILTVSNINDFIKYFDKNNIVYEITSNTTINIYEKNNLAKFIIELTQNNLIVDDAKEIEESLESYYMNLIGENEND